MELAAVLVEFPVLALVPAALFFALGVSLGRRTVLAAGAGWFVYAIYEFLMYARILCSGECNIRIDLLFVVYPLLAVVTLVGVVNAVRGGRETRASR